MNTTKPTDYIKIGRPTSDSPNQSNETRADEPQTAELREYVRQSREVKDKRNYYKTARARISCALFKKNDFVAVRYLNQGDQGTHWFLVSASKEGLDTQGRATCCPQCHLTDFVL